MELQNVPVPNSPIISDTSEPVALRYLEAGKLDTPFISSLEDALSMEVEDANIGGSSDTNISSTPPPLIPGGSSDTKDVEMKSSPSSSGVSKQPKFGPALPKRPRTSHPTLLEALNFTIQQIWKDMSPIWSGGPLLLFYFPSIQPIMQPKPIFNPNLRSTGSRGRCTCQSLIQSFDITRGVLAS